LENIHSAAQYSINSFAFVVLSRASASTMKSTQIFSLLAVALCSTTTTLSGVPGYDGYKDMCMDGNGNFLCYDPNGMWPLGTTTCSEWDSAKGTCSLGSSSGSIDGGIGEVPADLEVEVATTGSSGGGMPAEMPALEEEVATTPNKEPIEVRLKNP
jgi:hypothetical protein